jgi:hypothetical protein
MKNKLSILSNIDSMRYFKDQISEEDAVNVLSDVKHRIFPRPFERLSPVRNKKNLVGAEIGVCGGEHALSLLKTFDICKIYLIDPYKIYEEYKEGRDHYGIDMMSLEDSEKSAKKLLSSYEGKIVWLKYFSENAANLINEELDFVYIDGNHAVDYVRKDIETYYPLIKKGGVIGGHDFYNGFQYEHDGVIQAVIEWAVKKEKPLKVEMPDWWIVK